MGWTAWDLFANAFAMSLGGTMIRDSQDYRTSQASTRADGSSCPKGRSMSTTHSSAVQIQSAGLSDTGKVRKRNEDSFKVDEEIGLFMVCDGMGGHNAGDVASQTACKIIHSHLEKNQDKLQEIASLKSRSKMRTQSIALIYDAIAAANTKVHKLSESQEDKGKMGSTVALVLIIGQRAIIAHAGDSRIHLVRGGQIHQLTADHSSVDVQLKRGAITATQALQLAGRSPVTRSIGTKPAVKPEYIFMDLVGGDRFVICSDGLTNHISANRILSQSKKMTGEKLVDMLVRMANHRGGEDNVTVVDVLVGPINSKSDDRITQELELLKSTDLFKHFHYVERLKILGNSSIRSFEAEDEILVEGKPNVHFWVVLNGSAQMFNEGEMIAVLEKGDFFGDISVIDGKSSWMDVTTMSKMHVLAIERAFFLTLLNEEPHLSSRLLSRMNRVLIQRLRDEEEEYDEPFGDTGDALADLMED
jgi:serine/threonine protein phosphatase PrpC